MIIQDEGTCLVMLIPSSLFFAKLVRMSQDSFIHSFIQSWLSHKISILISVKSAFFLHQIQQEFLWSQYWVLEIIIRCICNFFLKTDFALVAKLGQVKSVKKSELRQALRTKVNSMKFSVSNPGYFVSKINMAAFTLLGLW